MVEYRTVKGYVRFESLDNVSFVCGDCEREAAGIYLRRNHKMEIGRLSGQFHVRTIKFYGWLGVVVHLQFCRIDIDDSLARGFDTGIVRGESD